MALTFTLLFSCCKNDDDMIGLPIKELDCTQIECTSIDEFYGVGLMNNNCWISDYSVLDPFSPFAMSIIIGKEETNGISESLRFVVNNETKFSDTIWLGGADFVNVVPGVAHSSYYYDEGGSSAGVFDFNPDVEFNKTDFLLIDYINEDTSIVEGRFQMRFSRRNVNGFVIQAPDTMRFQCGSFRAKKL